MTGSFSSAGVSNAVLVQPGASARFGLVVAEGEGFIGTVGLQLSRDGGATWQTAYATDGTLLQFTGTVAVPLASVAANYTVANESRTAVRYRAFAGDIDGTSDAIAYTVDLAPASTLDGLGTIKHARATFDPSGNASHRTAAAHGLGVSLPLGAIVIGGHVDVITTCADGVADAATIAIKVQGAGDLVVANDIADVSDLWDEGVQAIVPDLSDPTTAIKLTAVREIVVTVGGVALIAGKLVVHLLYVE